MVNPVTDLSPQWIPRTPERIQRTAERRPRTENVIFVATGAINSPTAYNEITLIATPETSDIDSDDDNNEMIAPLIRTTRRVFTTNVDPLRAALRARVLLALGR